MVSALELSAGPLLGCLVGDSLTPLGVGLHLSFGHLEFGLGVGDEPSVLGESALEIGDLLAQLRISASGISRSVPVGSVGRAAEPAHAESVLRANWSCWTGWSRLRPRRPPLAATRRPPGPTGRRSSPPPLAPAPGSARPPTPSPARRPARPPGAAARNRRSPGARRQRRTPPACPACRAGRRRTRPSSVRRRACRRP